MRCAAIVLAIVFAAGCADEVTAPAEGDAGSGGGLQTGGASGGAGTTGSAGMTASAGTTGTAGTTGLAGTTGAGTGGATAASYSYCTNLGWQPTMPADCSQIGTNTVPLYKDGYRCLGCAGPQRPAGVPDCWYSGPSRGLCVISCDECAPQ